VRRLVKISLGSHINDLSIPLCVPVARSDGEIASACLIQVKHWPRKTAEINLSRS